jgi:hypothetical protein
MEPMPDQPLKLPCLELWVDDPPILVKTAAYWARLRELGVQTAALMVDTTETGFDLVYGPRDLETIANLARQYDIALAATMWPEPDMAKIDKACEMLDRDVLPLGFVALENDAEHNWRTDKVVGFESLDGAAAYLAGRQRDLCLKHDLRLEMTTHTGHREAGPRAVLARLVDRCYYQLYSTESDWQGRAVVWSGPRGPGRLQREFLEKVRLAIPELADGRVGLAAGLAFYDQKWPSHTVEEALDAAVAPLTAPDILAIRAWSSKWAAGVKSQTTNQRAVSAWVKGRWGFRP